MHIKDNHVVSALPLQETYQMFLHRRKHGSFPYILNQFQAFFLRQALQIANQAFSCLPLFWFGYIGETEAKFA